MAGLKKLGTLYKPRYNPICIATHSTAWFMSSTCLSSSTYPKVLTSGAHIGLYRIHRTLADTVKHVSNQMRNNPASQSIRVAHRVSRSKSG